jgi:hypothetical protein
MPSDGWIISAANTRPTYAANQDGLAPTRHRQGPERGQQRPDDHRAGPDEPTQRKLNQEGQNQDQEELDESEPAIAAGHGVGEETGRNRRRVEKRDDRCHRLVVDEIERTPQDGDARHQVRDRHQHPLLGSGFVTVRGVIAKPLDETDQPRPHRATLSKPGQGNEPDSFLKRPQ